MKKTLAMLLTLCLLASCLPIVHAEDCPKGGVHDVTQDIGTYTITTTDPTCQKKGMRIYTCTECGEVFWEEGYLDPLDHNYRETERKNPTCTENGYVTYACSKCLDSYTDILQAEGHNQSGPVFFQKATCTQPETEYVQCTKCLQLQENGTTGEALGHDYRQTNVVPSTCAVAGYITYTCNRCPATYNDPLPLADHNYEVKTAPATCTEGERCYDECSECGDTTTGEYVSDPLGHDYHVQEFKHVEPTCEERGSDTHKCARCGEGYMTALGALGHDWTTTDGYTYTCTRCGKVEVDEEAKAEAEATPIPSAYGSANEKDELTDLTLTSAIKEVGGGYSLRREEATLNSISLAAERDPENSWMRLTAADPASQLGMVSGFIGDDMTMTLTENDKELKITGVSMKDSVLTITTSSGAVFELSTPGVSLGYTELDSISEKNLDRIIFKRSGGVLMIDFGSAEAMKAEVAAALATPAPTYHVEIKFSKANITTPTPTPAPIYVVNITFSKANITREEPSATPEPTVAIVPEEECRIVIIAYDDEEDVANYERSICPHQWEYAEENTCQASRTCKLCGKQEDTPSEHCWYAWNKVVDGKQYDMNVTSITDANGFVITDYVVSTYILKCRYCDATMEETSLNQVAGKCTHPRLKEKTTAYVNDGDDVRKYWCTNAMQCPDCHSQVKAVGHNWKITGESGDYYTAVCQRCGKTINANKKYYNSAKGKLDTSEMSCADDPNNHRWVTVESNGCKQTLVCSNCGKQTTTDHDWEVTKQLCNYTAVCRKCGKTEKVTIHPEIDVESINRGETVKKWWIDQHYEYNVYVTYAYCTSCGLTLASEKAEEYKISFNEYKNSDYETKKIEKLKRKFGVDKFPATYTLPVYLTDGYINSK